MTINIAARRKRQKEYEQRARIADPEGFKAKRSAASARWRTKNKERHEAMVRSWRQRNPEYGAQWRAKNFERYQRMTREARHKSVQRYPAPEHCERCGERMADTPKGPQFDHDHVTGFHRGWLCNSCNNGIARLGDTIDGLKQALAYLERAEAAWRISILS